MNLRALSIILLIPFYSLGMVDHKRELKPSYQLEISLIDSASEAEICNGLYYYILYNIDITPSVEATLDYLSNRIYFLQMQQYKKRKSIFENNK